jgi:hypothetical protein
MKSKLTIFVASLLLTVWSLSINAQTTIPQGKTQLIEFTNATAKFTVPEGKTWAVYSAFTSYNASDDYTYSILLKSINGTELTDFSKNQVGLILYSSNGLVTINLPLFFPENTTFELIISKRLDETRTLYDNKAFLNYIEIDN